MATTGTRSAMRAPASITPCTVAPAASARVPAAWMTGPSANGSENGTPSSTRSAPPSAYASPIAREAARSGKPPIRYGMSAARLPEPAKAAAIRSAPAIAPAAGGGAAGSALTARAPRRRRSARSRRRAAGRPDRRSRPGLRGRAGARQPLGQVLVAAPRAAHHVDGAVGRLQRVVQRVRGLERRDDALQARDPLERGERLAVVDRHVARPAGVAQPRMLRARAGVVEAG